MFVQMNWLGAACNVGTSVPKSRATSSYLSPRHFMAASTMSGSWPTILLGSFGSRYMTGGSVGSRPTLRVLPARQVYFAATLPGSHAACAEVQARRASAPTTHATMLLQRCRVISAPWVDCEIRC